MTDMKTSLLMVQRPFALILCLHGSSNAQTKMENLEPDRTKPRLIAIDTKNLEAFPYDAGSAKFIATSDDTNGAWSLVELTEMPGYHTNLHRHNRTSEAFYILEGVLTVKIRETTAEYPAGSYVLIPPGTPHAQGNRGKVPVRLLLTMTPGGFERSFRDRAELMKTMKPGDPEFRKKRLETAAKFNYDVEFLENWGLPK